MIARVEGTIIYTSEKYAVIDVAGVGYKVFLTTESLNACSVGSPASFWTYMAVRETALDLYGFASIDDMNFFELLLEISGIGPKSALGIMSITNVESLSEAIATGDTAYLTKVSGIGKKTAERIIIELKDKIIKKGGNYSANNLRGESDALEALKALGYREQESREALKQISTDLDTSTRVKQALKILGM